MGCLKITVLQMFCLITIKFKETRQLRKYMYAIFFEIIFKFWGCLVQAH